MNVDYAKIAAQITDLLAQEGINASEKIICDHLSILNMTIEELRSNYRNCDKGPIKAILYRTWKRRSIEGLKGAQSPESVVKILAQSPSCEIEIKDIAMEMMLHFLTYIIPTLPEKNHAKYN